jgi:small subunit ribosomal protein S19
MSRSSWKIPYIILNSNKEHSRAHIKINDRAAVITPTFIGKTVQVNNGYHYVPFLVTERHVGFKFGAFALTKKRARLKK